jgi:hypothetical protein
MLKYLIPTILISTGAVAQEATPFMSYQNCASFQVLADQTVRYEEKMLFTGLILQQHISRQPVEGQMAFTVNQDTGSWTLIHLFPNGVACMVANGTKFEPYIGN